MRARRDRFVLGCAAGLLAVMLYLLVTVVGNTPGMATAHGVNWAPTAAGTSQTGHTAPTPTAKSHATSPANSAGSSPTATAAATATDQPSATSTAAIQPTEAPTATVQATSQPTAGSTATATTAPTVVGTVPATPNATDTPQPTAPPTPVATVTIVPTATATGIPSPSATATPQPRPTATPLPSPTATATPSGPVTATVRFTAASQSKSSNPNLTGCPGASGCDFADTPINHSVTGGWHVSFSTGRQAALQGNVTVRAPNGANCGGGPCSISISAWVGGTVYSCGVYSIKLPIGGATTVFCRMLYITNPHSIAAGAFSGLCAGCGGFRNADIVWSNPSALYWVALESSTDCNNALGGARANAHNALIAYWNASTSGQWVIRGPSYSGYFNEFCNSGPGSYTQAFDAFASQTITGLAYSPAQAQAAARRRLNALLDSGYHWVSQTTCTPTTTGSNGNNVLVACGESGVEAVTWTSAMKTQLAQSLASKSLAAATTQCNAYPGIAPGSCRIQLSAGSTMPSDPSAISIQPSDPAAAAAAPAAAANSLASSGRSLASGSAFAEIPALPLLSLPFLAGFACAFGGALISIVSMVALRTKRRWPRFCWRVPNHTHIGSIPRSSSIPPISSTRSRPSRLFGQTMSGEETPHEC